MEDGTFFILYVFLLSIAVVLITLFAFWINVYVALVGYFVVGVASVMVERRMCREVEEE